jgi:hypothetical protein
MIETSDTARESEAEALRRCADMLCHFLVCGNAACRRARACRGRAHLCARRNHKLLPKRVRAFFVAFLAAQWAGLPFDQFKADMEGREETEALFAWRRLAGDRLARARAARVRR